MKPNDLYYTPGRTDDPGLAARKNGKHHRPHIHAQHADKTASFDIETREILAGEMDKDDVDRVRGWMSIHKEELFANWKLLGEEGTFFKIEPLR